MSWTIDPAHSRIEFSVKHMAIATVRGTFRSFTFDAETNSAGDLIGIDASIEAHSIDTNVEQRDAHLRSADFLDADNHPTIGFRSTRIDRTAPDVYEVQGELTIRGVTKPVSFQLTRSRLVRDSSGSVRAGAEATGRLNRRDWGLNWNQALEFGGVLVGEEVRFAVDVQAVAQQRAAVA